MGRVKNFFFYLKLKQKYTFEGSLDEFKSHLDELIKNVKHNSFTTKFQPGGSIKLTAKISFGTVQFNDAFGPSIAVIMRTKSLTKERQEIIFSSNVRLEHYLLLFTGILVGLISFLTNESFLTILITLAVFSICHIWFHWIYRAQEKSIVSEVSEKLKLKST